ncbi:disease resistance protein RPV1-like, partial [Telopea speciosissima]|uniref:disease resistance protein RPV1-like n=1 Tax=Telopea speciosissima TaxID=54955 RepID=UPI001CC4BE0F
MQGSKLKEVWKGTKHLTKLKELNLESSHQLTRTPDFSGLPNLEKLILGGCVRLVEVHESIDCRTKLVELILCCCSNLSNLPSGISKLASLETLDISHSSKLKKLPKGIGNLKSLTMLNVSHTAIEELPSSLGLLKNLATFSYSLELHPTGRVSVSLDLSGSYIEKLPSSIGQLSQLQTLNLRNCLRLESLPMFPSSLRSLCAYGCIELKRLPNMSNLEHLTSLRLEEGENLIEIEGLEGLKSATTIKLHGCVGLKSSVKNRIFQVRPLSLSLSLS